MTQPQAHPSKLRNTYHAGAQDYLSTGAQHGFGDKLAALSAQMHQLTASVKHMEAVSSLQAPRLAALEEAVPRLQVAAEEIGSWMSELERLTTESFELQEMMKETEREAHSKLSTVQERLSTLESRDPADSASISVGTDPMGGETPIQTSGQRQADAAGAEPSKAALMASVRAVFGNVVAQLGGGDCRGEHGADDARLAGGLRAVIQAAVDQRCQAAVHKAARDMVQAEVAAQLARPGGAVESVRRRQQEVGSELRELGQQLHGTAQQKELADVRSQLNQLIFDSDVQERLLQVEKRMEHLESGARRDAPVHDSESGSDITLHANPSFKGWDGGKRLTATSLAAADTQGDAKDADTTAEKVPKCGSLPVEPPAPGTCAARESSSMAEEEGPVPPETAWATRKEKLSPPTLNVGGGKGITWATGSEAGTPPTGDITRNSAASSGAETQGLQPALSRSKAKPGGFGLRRPGSPHSDVSPHSPCGSLAKGIDRQLSRADQEPAPAWLPLSDAAAVIAVVLLCVWALAMLATALDMHAVIDLGVMQAAARERAQHVADHAAAKSGCCAPAGHALGWPPQGSGRI
eukprot:jgi/Tetstr1/432985/TSEL_022322.t1